MIQICFLWQASLKLDRCLLKYLQKEENVKEWKNSVYSPIYANKKKDIFTGLEA